MYVAHIESQNQIANFMIKPLPRVPVEKIGLSLGLKTIILINNFFCVVCINVSVCNNVFLVNIFWEVIYLVSIFC